MIDFNTTIPRVDILHKAVQDSVHQSHGCDFDTAQEGGYNLSPYWVP